MKSLIRFACSVGTALTVGLGITTVAAAQDKYPNRPIRLIVPYGPGGSLDPIGRTLGDELAKRLGQPVVIENIAGANGMIGTMRTKTAEPDGYTLLVGITSNISLAPLVDRNAKYTSADFDALNMVGTSGLVLVTRPDLPVKTLPELLALARKQPGKLNYAIPGNGSVFHLAMEHLKADAGVDIVAVPYKGAGPAVIDVMGSQVDMAMVGLPAMLGHISSGKMKALAVMSKERDIGNKNIPSASEVPELSKMDYTIWTGLFAPKGTPEPIKQTLHTHVAAILADPAIVAKYNKMGVEVSKPQSMQAFSSFLQKEYTRLQQDMKRTNFKAE